MSQAIAVKLRSYEDAPHRLVRLAAVAAALGETLLSRIVELADEKGILKVVMRVEIGEADEVFVGRVWSAVGREPEECVEFLLESAEA